MVLYYLYGQEVVWVEFAYLHADEVVYLPYVVFGFLVFCLYVDVYVAVFFWRALRVASEEDYEAAIALFDYVLEDGHQDGVFGDCFLQLVALGADQGCFRGQVLPDEILVVPPFGSVVQYVVLPGFVEYRLRPGERGLQLLGELPPVHLPLGEG